MGAELSLFTTQGLDLYPKGIPGAFIKEKQFIIIMCGDEKIINK